MSHLFLTPNMLAKLGGVTERRELGDETGKQIGYFESPPAELPAAEKWWPFTAKQVAQAMRREGRLYTLDEIAKMAGMSGTTPSSGATRRESLFSRHFSARTTSRVTGRSSERSTTCCNDPRAPKARAGKGTTTWYTFGHSPSSSKCSTTPERSTSNR